MKTQKVLEPVNDLCIRFTEEEIEQLGLSPGDKFSCSVEDGAIVLKKYEELSIELDQLSKENLIQLIVQSVEKNITIEQVIEDILESIIDREDLDEDCCNNSCGDKDCCCVENTKSFMD